MAAAGTGPRAVWEGVQSPSEAGPHWVPGGPTAVAKSQSCLHAETASLTWVPLLLLLLAHMMGLPQRTLPLCLTVKLKNLFQDPVHL